MEATRGAGTDGGRSVGNGGSPGGLEWFARAAAGVAAVAGVGGSSTMLGAFGPVSCATSQTSGSSTGGTTATTSRTCTAGIDYLFGAGGNAPVLFFWSMVLLGIVAVGAWSVWTERRGLTWMIAILSGVVTVIGVFSIGWYFLVPAVGFFAAALARTVASLRRSEASAS